MTRFDLAPLDPADALSLARIHFATSPDLAQRCVDRAQGNPLFLVQLLRSDTDDPSIPATIQSVVLARLDRLSPRDKAAVQAASIIGQRFEIELLAPPDSRCFLRSRRADRPRSRSPRDRGHRPA